MQKRIPKHKSHTIPKSQITNPKTQINLKSQISIVKLFCDLNIEIGIICYLDFEFWKLHCHETFVVKIETFVESFPCLPDILLPQNYLHQ